MAKKCMKNQGFWIITASLFRFHQNKNKNCYWIGLFTITFVSYYSPTKMNFIYGLSVDAAYFKSRFPG